jgi:quinohemoprotein amine dehydrogenase
MLRIRLAVLAALFAPLVSLEAQQRDTTSGFPIRDQTVLSACSGCHVADSAGIVQRLSFLRKTPEGWEMSIRRMVTLYRVPLDTAAARRIVRYLSDQQGLAPEEARPARFESERRLVDYTYAADSRTETTCRACHSMGRVLLQRRTREEWALLIATHRGLYPLVDNQSFRRNPPASPEGESQQPMDQAIQHLSRAFPLRTPEWAAWSATMRAPRLEGTWLLTGHELGKGPLFGRVTITRGAADGEFVTRAAYRYAGAPVADAPRASNADAMGRVTREGRSVVFTGFQWRGRSTAGGGAPLREVLLVEPGWQEMSGRWYAGAYDELGVDVKLTRVTGAPLVAAVMPRALRKGATSDVTLLGANLPTSAETGALDFGPGVRVDRVLSAGADSMRVRVTVASDAPVGARDVFVAGATLRGAAVVYDQVSRIKVTPGSGLARVGGVVFPKQLQQFEAVAYHDGADGRPDTPDDLELGPVEAQWSLEEYGVTFEDDDVRWVGELSPRGLFTPAADGPNPLRNGNRNNVGDVWVVATYQPAAPARPIRARALLIVTVPLYLRFDPWSAPR